MRSSKVSRLVESSTVAPIPEKESAVCNFFASAASAKSSSSMKSSGRCCAVFGWSFALLVREDTNVDGVHPSLDPTVLKYLCQTYEMLDVFRYSGGGSLTQR